MAELQPHELVAAQVREEMARQGISQVKLARLLGVAQQTVSRRIVGEVPFDITELARVADLLNVPLTKFVSAAERAA